MDVGGEVGQLAGTRDCWRRSRPMAEGGRDCTCKCCVNDIQYFINKLVAECAEEISENNRGSTEGRKRGRARR